MTNTPTQDHPPFLRDARALSPAQRMARFADLQKQAFALLAASPEGYRRFWHRNLQKRRIHASF
jgi:hypothetical protein